MENRNKVAQSNGNNTAVYSIEMRSKPLESKNKFTNIFAKNFSHNYLILLKDGKTQAVLHGASNG